jgi:hypothetical protein
MLPERNKESKASFDPDVSKLGIMNGSLEHKFFWLHDQQLR